MGGHHRSRRIVAAAMLSVITIGTSAACPPQKLTPVDAVAQGRFGTAVGVSASSAVIGGRIAAGGALIGAIDAYERFGDAWTRTQQLTAPPEHDPGGFGLILAIAGDVLVVGDPSADDACEGDPACDSGAVLIYERDGAGARWTPGPRLLASDAAPGAAFGRSVAVHDGLLAVGAPETGDGGAVYVFERIGPRTWVERARLVVPGQRPGSDLGQAVAVTNTAIAASAPALGTVPGDPPRVHVFERGRESGAWTHIAGLESDGRSPSDGFGGAITLGPSMLVVGAPGDDEVAVNAGAAYVFTRDVGGGWALRGKLVRDEALAQTSFGASVAVDDEFLAVSSLPLLEDGVTRTYRIDGMGVVRSVGVTPAVPSSDLFGWMTALDGNALLVAAIGDDEGASNAGAVYAFEFDRCRACVTDVDHDGATGLSDLLAVLAAWGPCAEARCFTDLDGDDVTGFADLVLLLSSWGECRAAAP